MYVLQDPNAGVAQRMLKAVKDEGMPTYKNPFVHGNLFLILTIEFPESLSPESQSSIRSLLPPALNEKTLDENDDGVEVHNVTDIDPVQSYNANKVNMQAGNEAYDDDDEDGSDRMHGPGGVSCQQQ